MNTIQSNIPLLGFAAPSGTGKTTLLTGLLPVFKARGLCVGVIKHAHHNFDIDKPGKDSFELRKSGANKVLVASRQRYALIVEQNLTFEPTLEYCLQRFPTENLDLLLVEGFKKAAISKIELVRHHQLKNGYPFLYLDDENIIAIASDQDFEVEKRLPLLPLNDYEVMVNFIVSFFNLKNIEY